MSDAVSEYVAWSDNANEYANDQREKLKQSALEDIDNLMREVEDRDPELWGEFEIDEELVVADYEEEDPQSRDFGWVAGLSALATAAGVQFFLDNRGPLIINPAAYRAQVLDPFNLTRVQFVKAGARQVSVVSIEKYQTLQAKYVKEFSFLKNMSNSELYAELQRVNGLQSFDKLAADASGYVSRMTNLPPNSTQFKGAVSDLVNMESGTAQQGMNRRSIEGLSVERQIQGDENLPMVWILDPTSSHCPYCPERAGIIMSYRDWQEDGLPGSGVCKGGDKCNCHLSVV